VAADRQAAVERACTVLEEGGGLRRYVGLEIRIFLPRRESGTVEERDDLLEKTDIPCELKVLNNYIR
jgi:hypothetical protein